MKKLVFFIVVACSAFIVTNAQAQSDYDPKWSIVSGLTQPILLKGFNIEANYFTKKFVIDYSHGFGLQIDGATTAEQYKNQKIDFRMAHTLGIGFGYRFTKAFNLRVEPKLHVYETYYDGSEQKKINSIANFSTYTLGLGAYYRWLPFAKKDNALKGITLSPSIRWWPKVGSSLGTNEELKYFNKQTNQSETLKAPQNGIANSPLIVNVSVGYSF